MMSAKAVSSGDIILDEAVDAKVKEEVEIEAIIGPFTCLEDIAQGDPVAVIPRFGIWEQHGGQVEETCRVIDVLLVNGAMSSCVDDVICIERLETVGSAYVCWRELCNLLGWDVPDSKSPPPERSFQVLGIFLDLSGTPQFAFHILITEKRLEKLLKLLTQYLTSQRLAPGEAASLFGQLSWTCITHQGQFECDLW